MNTIDWVEFTRDMEIVIDYFAKRMPVDKTVVIDSITAHDILDFAHKMRKELEHAER